MGSLVAAYLGGWLAVVAYAAWLARQNANLARRMDELETAMEEQVREERARAKAA